MQESIHPISGVMQTALENIKDMIDVNTVVGEPMVTGSGSTVIPVSKVSFGFVAGGGEYNLPQPTQRAPLRAVLARVYRCSRLAFWCSARKVCICCPRRTSCRWSIPSP